MRYLILAFLLLGFSSYAQPTISKQVIGPSGATFENGNNKLRCMKVAKVFYS